MLKKVLALPPVSFGLEVADVYTRIGASRSAAALSYFLILTLFPLLLCVNHFIGLFHLDLEQLLQALDQVLPPGALAVMGDYLAYVSGSRSGALFWAGLVTILISASAALRTLFHTMDVLYRVENRNMLGRILLSVALSALFLLTVYLSVVVIFTGDWFFGLLEHALPRRLAELVSALSGLWRWMRYLLLFCFVLLLVLMVYRAGIPQRYAGNRWILLTALCTALAIVACSVLFSWFIGMSSRYALVYGSLASLMILLVWLYFCGNILLLGAVIGQVLARRGAARRKK
ncbi:MAG: YihY/virulence factor BrkB family protein [Lawsonibacter sp.]|nr:YihY/virulence factor BrkB family protein [Lawsonibacter sp.]